MSNSSQSSSLILSYNLKYFRQLSELTQELVAKQIGISIRTYNELESGISNPTLSTLNQLADYYKVVVSQLIKLNRIKLIKDPDSFLNQIKTIFADEDIGVVVRNFEGVALWGNQHISKISDLDFSKGPTLGEAVLGQESLAIMKAQLAAEKNGFVQSFLNSYVNSKSERLFYRISPTIIIPVKGISPIFSIAYVEKLELESNEKYFRFCNLLLTCIH